MTLLKYIVNLSILFIQIYLIATSIYSIYIEGNFLCHSLHFHYIIFQLFSISLRIYSQNFTDSAWHSYLINYSNALSHYFLYWTITPFIFDSNLYWKIYFMGKWYKIYHCLVLAIIHSEWYSWCIYHIGIYIILLTRLCHCLLLVYSILCCYQNWPHFYKNLSIWKRFIFIIYLESMLCILTWILYL